jgi:hypothetical protein
LVVALAEAVIAEAAKVVVVREAISQSVELTD